MARFLPRIVFAATLVLASVFGMSARAQIGPGPSIAYLYCQQSTGTWAPCSSTNPVPTGGGGGTANNPIVGTAQYGFAVTSATALTVPAGTTLAVVECGGQTVNYTWDGTVPTSTKGFPLTVGQYLYAQSLAAATALQIIQTASAATCNASYFK